MRAKTEMPQTKREARGGLKLLCALLVCILMSGALLLAASATEAPTAAPESTVAPEGTASATLSSDDMKALSANISVAAGDKKAEDTRTPRDKMTAAYFAGDLAGASAAVKEANEAAKKNAVGGIDYDKLTLTDIGDLVNEMKIRVDLEKPTGIFAAIQLAAGSVLSWFTMIVGGNYILGLLIFALAIELIMLPLSIKRQKTSIRQASLRPKEMAIRKKYAGRDDNVTKQKINTEIQELYQKEGYNPMSGCLPSLIQLPVIFILYAVVIDPIVYVMKFSSQLSGALLTFVNTSEAAGGLGAAVSSSRGTIEIASIIKDYGQVFFDKLSNFSYFTNGSEIASALEGASWPNFSLFGVNLGIVPSLKEFGWLWLIPILTFAAYFGSMKLTRKLTYQPVGADQATGCSNNVMDIVMPLFSVYICFVVPAALGVYWIFKSVISTGINFVLSRAMPLPQFTDEDYKAAEREIKGKAPAPSQRIGASGKAARSLHHIDDEDYEDTRQQALERKAKLEALEAEEQQKAEAAQNARVESGLMKNEDDRPQLTLKELRQKVKEKKRLDAEAKKAGKDKSDDDAGDQNGSPDGKKQ